MLPSGTKVEQTGQATWPFGGRPRELPGWSATADKERTIILAEANRKSEEIRGGGDAKAIEIAAVAFGADPEFYEFYRTLESYKQAIKPGSSFLLSTRNDYTKNLTNYLPNK